MHFKLIALLLCFSTTAFAQITCQEIITKNDSVVYPAGESLSYDFYLGLDWHDISIELWESKETYDYIDVDRNSLACIQKAGGANRTTRVYEKDKILAYTLYPTHVDYYIIVPRHGVDDIVFFRTTMRDHNIRTDNRIFFKKSSFHDLEEIKAMRVIENYQEPTPVTP